MDFFGIYVLQSSCTIPNPLHSPRGASPSCLGAVFRIHGVYISLMAEPVLVPYIWCLNLHSNNPNNDEAFSPPPRPARLHCGRMGAILVGILETHHHSNGSSSSKLYGRIFLPAVGVKSDSEGGLWLGWGSNPDLHGRELYIPFRQACA